MPSAGSPKRPSEGTSPAPDPTGGQTSRPVAAKPKGRPRRSPVELCPEGARPPYTCADRIENGVQCFMCGQRDRAYTDWLQLRTHLEQKHAMRAQHCRGTYLDHITKELRRAARGDKITTRAQMHLLVERGPDAQSLSAPHRVTMHARCDRATAPSPTRSDHQSAAAVRPPLAALSVKEEIPQAANRPEWCAMPVLVRCDAGGAPLLPPTYGGVAHGWSVVRTDAPHLKHEGSERSSYTQGVKAEPGSDSPNALAIGAVASSELGESGGAELAQPLPDPAVPGAQNRPDCATGAAQPSDGRTSGGCTVAALPTAAVPFAAAQRCPDAGDGAASTSPLKMLAELVNNTRAMTDRMDEMRDTARWRKGLPRVEVKEKYVNLDAVEERMPDGRKRCSYPSDLAHDVVALPEFSRWLTSYCRMDEKRARTHVLGAGRLLGMLTFRPDGVPQMPVCPSDCAALVALSVSEKQFALLDIPLLKPHFTWTLTCIDGVCQYCSFHSYQLNRQVNLGVAGFWKEYLASLEALRKDFRSGHLKRCREEKEKSLIQKHKEDIKVIKNWPKLHDLQAAVLEGYMTLLLIADKYEGAAELPRAARGAANTAMAGAIHYDTFASRKECVRCCVVLVFPLCGIGVNIGICN